MTIRRPLAVRRLRQLSTVLALALLAHAALPAGEVKALPALAPPAGQLTLEAALAEADTLNETAQVARARLDEALAVRRQALATANATIGKKQPPSTSPTDGHE